MAAARAYLTGGRIGGDLDRLNTLRADIAARFAAVGAARVEPETLQSADLLLDLYGEDIRARAYVVQDPVAGEMMLRPDFTVPVARLHMEGGAELARYAYDGLVWRRQEPGSDRPTEYLQAGVEMFGGDDPAAAEAEVFVLIRDALADAPATPVTGDLGVVFAAIAALNTTEPRRAALRRHVWRPERFQRLLDRYAAP
ncbi:MAG: ATP phosphoribosyltransferase regulatory subunit, partial [Pseudomonadota bacterium]